ncbi:YeeE/YedE family protein [Halococcus agarilyticus]|uniref:YeeE/YedE family protein n=1 Tax=Halococcus agarilyticus TaxID=1232219 RepID=UPI0006780755|nr:YeeE/YedE family protein [Halococcus agarilyticus]
MSASDTRHPLFVPLIAVGGSLFGFGLAYSGMARPEIVLDFLQLEDLGLLFVMGGAAAVTGTVITLAMRHLDRAPLTGDPYGKRERSFDRSVLLGGAVFGVGWGISGLCPGSAYASLGIGNYPILLGIAGMFLGAYAQGYWRAYRQETDRTVTPSD